MCWILLHPLQQYRCGLQNTPGGGITTLDFIVKMRLSAIATSLVTLLIVSTTIGLELTMVSTSSKQVTQWLLIKTLCVLIRDESMILADLICLSHAPPIWLAIGGFFCHTIWSALFFSNKSPILWLSISFMHISSFFSASIKSLPLSHQIDLKLPCLAMKWWSARMNESASILLVISMWIARWLDQTCPHVSTPQYV